MSEPLHTGRCNCGAVRFEITEPLTAAGYCHCTRCQRRTGCAASSQAFVEPGSVRVLSGADQLRAWTPPDGFAKVFCSACGSSMWTATHEGEIRAVRLGVFDEDPGVRLTYRQFTDFAAGWEPIPDDGLERFPGRRT